MPKIIANVFLGLGLTLLAQSIFAIFASNNSYSDQHRVAELQAQIQQAQDRNRILENKIAAQKSLTSEQIQNLDLESAGYVPIEDLIFFNDTLASL